jgi:hypothetical protein
MWSAIFKRLLITFNLSLTLAPPRTATTGFLGLWVILDKLVNSFSIK